MTATADTPEANEELAAEATNADPPEAGDPYEFNGFHIAIEGVDIDDLEQGVLEGIQNDVAVMLLTRYELPVTDVRIPNDGAYVVEVERDGSR